MYPIQLYYNFCFCAEKYKDDIQELYNNILTNYNRTNRTNTIDRFRLGNDNDLYIIKKRRTYTFGTCEELYNSSKEIMRYFRAEHFCNQCNI